MTTVSTFLKLQFAIIILFWTNIWAVKASFLAVYKGIIDQRLNPWKTRAWWAITMFTALSYMGCWITQFLSCQPFHTYFELGQWRVEQPPAATSLLFPRTDEDV